MSGGVDVELLDRAIRREPWFGVLREPWHACAGARADGGSLLAALNALAGARSLRTGRGQALEFVGPAHAGSADYESGIAASGRVPTRGDGPGALHDLFNALVWLRFPLSKARLNAVQADAIARGAHAGGRGPVRDRATLFDENAALFVTDSAACIAALRAHRWRELFVDRRDEFVAQVAVHPFGHALMHKLLTPYKAISAHAWVVDLPAQTPLALLDDRLAGEITAQRLRDARFAPLPVLGVPGWCSGNRSADFYDDTAVFRPCSIRHRLSAAPGA